MYQLAYHLVDVFTQTPFGGNQLAVVLDADKLPDDLMQAIARELNLSETAFVMASTQADFQVRFFTPQIELPMAGHPTVGTAYVLQREGHLPASGSTRFEEGVGVIPITLDEDAIYMQQPVPTFGPVLEDRATLAAMLSLSADDLLDGYPVQAVSSGVPFTYIPLKNMNAIQRASLRRDVWAEVLQDFEAPHVFTFTPETVEAGSTVHSRMFAPAMGIAEDPATGAASGPLGAYLVKYGLVAADENDETVEIRSEQGYEMGRPSQVSIRVKRQAGAISGVQVGGSSVYMGRGQLLIPDERL